MEDYIDKFGHASITNESKFKKVLAECLTFPGVDVLSPILEHYHHRYFVSYLYSEQTEKLKVKTIIIEHDYTSSSYLGDYKNHYANCYKHYDKKCKRIHFFCSKFTKKEFAEMVTNPKSELSTNWNSYLGYIVVRPLPKGVIGATLLRPYPNKPGRHYTVRRSYPVNLFGKELIINSLPYQEQDGIVGTCASSSLWCAFQHTSYLFNTKSHTPSDITIMAGSNYLAESSVTNDLSGDQICNAIQSNNLLPKMQSFAEQDKNYVRGFLYAYLKMGIPVLLGLKDGDQGHLVTLSGYRILNSPVSEEGEIKIKLRSSQITKFYSHDDQTGPFSRLDFLDNDDLRVRTSHWVNSGAKRKVMTLDIAVAPVDKSIVVSFDDVLGAANKIDNFLSQENKLVFDIFLAESNKYKQEVTQEITKNSSSFKNFNILFSSLPKYIWVIKAYRDNVLKFDVLFDAIDSIYQIPFDVNVYDEEYNIIGNGTKTEKENQTFLKVIQTFLMMPT